MPVSSSVKQAGTLGICPASVSTPVSRSKERAEGRATCDHGDSDGGEDQRKPACDRCPAIFLLHLANIASSLQESADEQKERKSLCEVVWPRLPSPRPPQPGETDKPVPTIP